MLVLVSRRSTENLSINCCLIYFGKRFFFTLLSGAKGKGYGTFHEEAVQVFSSLLEQESIADPIPVIQVSCETK